MKDTDRSICEGCRKREAVVHLLLVQDGVRVRQHYCEQCATDRGATGAAWPTHPPSEAQPPNEEL
jgi:protein-arginine kinase activator protein McsA